MRTGLIRVLVVFGLVCCFAQARAAAVGDDERIAALEERVGQLEALLEKAGMEVPAESSVEEGLKIGDKVSVSGALEVEAHYGTETRIAGGRARSSDIVLATMELGIDAEINERTTGHILFLWEEDDTEPVDIDEGIITWSGDRFNVSAGRFYAPFGTFNTHFVSDPITLEMGETSESGVMVEYAPTDRFQMSVYAMNGDLDKTSSSDNVNDFGVRFDFHPVIRDGSTLDVGVQYHSDMADTNAEILGATGSIMRKKVGGLSANVDWANGPWSANAEYLGAVRDFDPADLDADGDGQGDRPAAWNFEVARAIGESFELAVKYEGCDELADFPGSQYGLAGSWGIAADTTLSAEYLYGLFDSDFSTTGARRRHQLATQLAIEF